MRKRWRQPKTGAGTRFIAKLLTVLSVLLIATVLLDMRLRPAIEAVVSYQARNAALRTIDGAMLEELSSMDASYDDIVRLTRAPDGSVASIQTDIVAINQIKARLTDLVASELKNAESEQLSIPLGTLLGGNLISGRGPCVEVRLIPAGYVRSEFYNQFVSAGINQTLHRIMLETTVEIVAILPGYRVPASVSTSFCIAETVIVGAIPDGYTVVGEDARSQLSKVNDYKAE